MIFGNTSLQDDVVLQDVAVPAALRTLFGGPRHDITASAARLGIPQPRH